MTPLLVLVDLQRDFLAAPGLEPAAETVVRRARELLDGCRERGVPVVHVQTTVSGADDRRMAHWKRDGTWRCEEGTPGHAPPGGLEPRPGEAVVHKTAFGAFTSGGLDAAIREHGATRLVIAGVHQHACVRQAVLEAYERRLEVWVAEDATGSDDPLQAAGARRWLGRRAARFAPVADVLRDLAQPAAGAEPWQAAEAAVGPVAERCREAARAWARTPVAERAAALLAFAARLEEEADALAERMAGDIGKPVGGGTLEVRRTAEMLRAICAHAVAATPEEAVAGTTATVRRRPLGVVALITPWNSPVYIAVGKLAAALAYGNAVLWKPAPAAQPISDRLAALLAASGLPGGVLGVVAGGRREAEAVMSHAAVDAVTVTGSSLAGFSAQEVCGRRRIPLQAELGGNNAALVWEDADMPDAAAKIAHGAFGLAGQRCTANRRVVVPADRAEEIVGLLARATAALAWGDPRDPATVCGPMLDAAERDRVAAVVARAAAAGHGVLTPHDAAPGGDLPYHPPTIVRCDDAADEIVQEETFGPVLVVQPARDWDDALALVNGVPQGLAAAVFTASAERVAQFLDGAVAGILKVGTSTADAEVDVPFGGWRWSGLGPPEHGTFDRDFYTRPQVVYRAA